MKRCAAKAGLVITLFSGISTSRCPTQLVRLILTSWHCLSDSSWPRKTNQQNAKCVCKRKRSITLCLILTALVALVCLSMLIQVLILSSNKVAFTKRLTLESLFDSHLSTELTRPHNLYSVQSLAGHTGYRQNVAYTISRQRKFDYWQSVNTSSHKFYVYSAFVDTYKRSNLNLLNAYLSTAQDDPYYFVRVIAATVLKTKDKLACCYNLPSNNNSHSSQKLKTTTCREGTIRAIREHWNLKYTASFVYCPVPRLLGSDLVNHSLSILAFSGKSSAFIRQNARLLRQHVPSNRLAIHAYTGGQFLDEASMALCVKPLHYHYNKSVSFIEFIELNRILGVRHFYFYNHTVGPEVDHILRKLALNEPSLVTILPWLLPIKSQTEIRTEGIFASLNDCLYRARKDQFRYVLFIDLDEFIIPQRHKTLNEMIAALNDIYPDQVGAFSFRNAFFYLQYPNEPIEMIQDEEQRQLLPQLITLTKTRRKSILNIHRQRSKFIAVSEDTIEVGNHFVWELKGKHKILNVNAKIATLNHYRNCEYGGDECIHQSASIVDRRMQLWAPKLIAAVQQHLRSLCASRPIQAQWQMCQFASIH